MEPKTKAELGTQYEEILAAVWKAEANWRFDDRLDLAIKNLRPQGRLDSAG